MNPSFIATFINRTMTKIPPLQTRQCGPVPFSRLSKVIVLATAIACSAVSSVEAAIIIDTNNLAPTGTLNLGNDAVLVTTLNGVIERASSMAAQAGNITEVRTRINAAFNGGLWDLPGITSGTVAADALVNAALAVMMYDNTLLNMPSFQGVTGLDADPEFKQMLLRVTYAGDYDASGTIDGGDYGLLDFYLFSGFPEQGDITGDGIVDGGDYGVVDFVLFTQPYGPLGASAAPAPGAAAPVPEPTTGCLLSLGVVAALTHRRRREKLKSN